MPVAMFASTVVSGLLALQALEASQQRNAIGDAMLRQHAQLAALEFSRRAWLEVERALANTLSSYAHSSDAVAIGPQASSCRCLTTTAVERWFEVPPSGEVGTDDQRLRDAVTMRLGRPSPEGAAHAGGAEGETTVFELPGDPTRLVALKPEPHLRDPRGRERGGYVGLIATVSSLTPMLQRAYDEAPLMPAWTTGGTARLDVVDLRVMDVWGTSLFSSPGTLAGPAGINVRLWPSQDVLITSAVSMTPIFVNEFLREHGEGFSQRAIWMLFIGNLFLVGIGVRQIKRERDLNRMRSDFIAGVSHEMRTPLAQIRMFSETLLLDRVRSEGERERALSIIGQESTRLGHLVDNVLQFHRPGDASSADRRQAVDLAAFVDEVAESFAPLAASKRVAITVEPSDRVLVRVDASELRQVLLNLLDNAVKFGPAGQTVRIGVRRGDRVAEMAVDDEGVGVPEVDRARIFRAFERGRDTRGTGGAGIGLAVVRDIVSAHGGHVKVSGAPGGGARFTVALPIADSETV